MAFDCCAVVGIPGPVLKRGGAGYEVRATVFAAS